MSTEVNPIMMLFSIVERGKGKALMEMMNKKDVRYHIQSVGHGTAPSEMMDILGLGTNDKDVVFSLAPKSAVSGLVGDLSRDLGQSSGFGGLTMVIRLAAVNRLAAEILSRSSQTASEKEENSLMSGNTKYNLIVINVNQGYADSVMHTARKSGATGGTVIRGRLAGTEKFEQLEDGELQEEKEIITILAPDTTCGQIMQDVNKEFGLRTEARGTVCAIPVEKAMKI